MNTIAAVCDVHGAFPSRMFAMLGGNVNLTLQGNSESCPTCGRQSKIVDGTFNISPTGIVEVLSAPEWTREVLRNVQDAFRSISRNPVFQSADSQLLDLEKVSPQAAELLKAATQEMTPKEKIELWATVLTFLITLLGVLQQGSVQDLSPAEIAVIVDEAVKQSHENIEEDEAAPPIAPSVQEQPSGQQGPAPAGP